jgi:hypothetical protein
MQIKNKRRKEIFMDKTCTVQELTNSLLAESIASTPLIPNPRRLASSEIKL